MTLYKQIALLVSLAFILLFSLIGFDNFQQSGLFLKGQLQTTAQDTARVLGIAISTNGSGNDIAALDTLFNAVFDSGYYSRIQLISNEGKVVHYKQRSLSVDGVPDWFVDIVPLTTATGRAQVMQGWMPLGFLEVKLHPGFAYASLYNNLMTTLLWFSVLFLLVLCLLWYVLHILFRPLKKVNEQADAIHDNRFIQQDVKPKTIELRRVVEAMNRLVTKVQQIFTEHQQTLVRYQVLLYTDNLTGLHNRRYMLSELEDILSEGAAHNGSLMIVKIKGLNAFRSHQGYADADSLVKELAEIINLQMKTQATKKYARMSDDEFALLLPSHKQLNANVITEIFAQFKEQFSIVSSDADMSFTPSLVAAATNVYSGRKLSEVLADLDLSLNQALAEGSYQCRYSVPTDLELPQGKMQWRNWLQQALADDRFYLVVQPVFEKTKKIIQQEVFIRVNDSKGKIIPAGVFMPMALSLGYGLEIDRAVFKLLKALVGRQIQSPLALNLSGSFFSHADAFEEFKQLLAYFKKNSVSLCIETTHSALLQYPVGCAQVIAEVKRAGQSFGIDNLDLNISVADLQSIQPDYVKINAKVLNDISEDSVSAAYHALRSVTSTLDIQLIAVGVDEQALYDRLLKLNVDAAQGYLFGQPEVSA